HGAVAARASPANRTLTETGAGAALVTWYSGPGAVPRRQGASGARPAVRVAGEGGSVRGQSGGRVRDHRPRRHVYWPGRERSCKGAVRGSLQSRHHFCVVARESRLAALLRTTLLGHDSHARRALRTAERQPARARDLA